MTRGDLIFRVARSLGLDDTVGSDELTLMQNWANEAVIDVLLRTHIFIDLGVMNLTEGEDAYRLDTEILAIDDGSGSTAAGIGPYDIVSLAEMISIQSAAPAGPTRKVVSIQGDLLTVAPVPESDESLTFYVVPRPTAMTVDTHDPSDPIYGGIPSEFHRALEFFMLWRGSDYDDKTVATRAQDYMQQYERELARIRKEKRGKQGRGLTAAVPGYPTSRGPLYGRNDIYPEPSR